METNPIANLNTRSVCSHLVAALWVLLVLLAACDNDKALDDALINYRLDIVTYAGTTDGAATFDYYGRGDSLPVTLLTTWTHDVGAKVGQRVLLRYGLDAMPDGGTASVKAYGISAIVSDTLRVSSLAPAIMGDDPVRLRSLWRTGPFLNVRCEVEYTGQHHRFGLVAEDATIDGDTVVCHLIHSLGGFTAMQWRELYGSFLIDEVIAGRPCRVLRVEVDNDVVRPSSTTYDFEL